jgi:hypothetical protein
MGQDLIQAAPEHDVTTRQHRHHIRITDHARPPPPTNQSPTHTRHGAQTDTDLPKRLMTLDLSLLRRR